MSLRTSANRYAKALFDVALEEKADLAKVDQDLQAVVAMMQASPDLAQASNRGAATDATRQSLMEAVSKAMTLTVPVTKTLVLLANSGKLNLIAGAGRRLSRASARAPEHRARRGDERGAAVAGEDARRSRTACRRSRARKSKCRSASIRNCSAAWSRRIGSTVYDGSVRTQLKRMRQELVEQ